MKLKNMNFGEAIEALKSGQKLSREGWNGNGMFIFKQIPAEISLDIIPKMQSVPQSVKNHQIEAKTTLKYTNQIVIVNSEGQVDTWTASATDIFAEDWFLD